MRPFCTPGIRGISLAIGASLVVCATGGAALGEPAQPYGRLSQLGANPPSAPGIFGWPAGFDFSADRHDAISWPLGVDIPVLDRYIQPPHFRHGDPDDPGRHVGWGSPLEGTSWRNRPLHAGWLWGSLNGGALIKGRVGQGDGTIGGYRLGWDFDHYWGTEGRFAFANIQVQDANSPASTRTSQDLFWDANLLYYPWGDARWRPFLSVGFGVASFRFSNDQSETVRDSLYAFPLGGGVKYLCKRWLAVRLSVMDNLAIGAYNLSTMHNVSLTCGVEVHFGGPRTSYFPYHAGKHLW